MRSGFGLLWVRLCAALVALGVGLSGSTLGALGGTVGSVRGTVADGDTHAPIVGARVTLRSPSDRYTAVTDTHGFYAIEGIHPDTYLLTISREGYDDFQEPDVSINQDTRAVVDAPLHKLKEIGSVTARSSQSLVQRHQASDVYSVASAQQSQLTGLPSSPNEAQLLNSLPGVSGVGGGTSGLYGSYPLIRGGLQNDQGYQLDGIDATEPLTNEFINNLVLNGSRSVNVTAGPGDASKGGSGSGYVNVVTKTGTYPSSGYLQLDMGTYAFEHNASFEFGTATPRGNLSLFVSGRYDRDFGGCCSPAVRQHVGRSGLREPRYAWPGGVQRHQRHGRKRALEVRQGRRQHRPVLERVGRQPPFGSYGINPSTYPYPSANPAYISIYRRPRSSSAAPSR